MKVFPGEWVAAWVAARIPHSGGDFGACVALGVEHQGRIVAGMVYHNWNDDFGTIEMSGAADDKRWMTRPVIHQMLAYPFGFCSAVLARHATDSPARAIWPRIGATETVVPHGLGEGRDMVVTTLTKTQWQQGRYYMRSEDG